MPAISNVADLPHNQNILLYSVPNGKSATVNINLCNRNDTACKVGILIVIGQHTEADFIECGTEIPPRGVLERSGLVMKAGENIFAVCNTGTGVSARVHGFEEDN